MRTLNGIFFAICFWYNLRLNICFISVDKWCRHWIEKKHMYCFLITWAYNTLRQLFQISCKITVGNIWSSLINQWTKVPPKQNNQLLLRFLFFYEWDIYTFLISCIYYLISLHNWSWEHHIDSKQFKFEFIKKCFYNKCIHFCTYITQVIVQNYHDD